VHERFRAGLKRLLPILEQQRTRDVSEADTVTLVKDVLSEVLGFDKYSDLTGEYAIRGTFCDLAIKLDEKISHLVEVKAIGIALKERHLKQALGYASNEGIEWLILTNGGTWQLYNVVFAKPIDKTLVAELDLFTFDLQDPQHAERLYAFSREGIKKGVHSKLRDRQEALSRHLVAAMLLQNRKVVQSLRREVRKVIGIRVDPRELRQVLRSDVIKRDILEDPAYEAALGKVRDGQAERVRGRRAKGGDAGVGPSRKSVTLADIVGAGVLVAPLRLHRTYKGARHEATLLADGRVEWGGQAYDSPSTAASAVRESVVGRPMATNGWSFWCYESPAGEDRTLAQARDEFIARRQGAQQSTG